MRDEYPSLPSIPDGCLVPSDLQPDYAEVPRAWLGTSLAAALVDHAAGDRIAIVHHEGRGALTFSDLSRDSRKLANALAGIGIEAGDRVAVRSPNRPEAIVAFVACWRLGAIVVPTPIQARRRELEFFLQDTGARCLIADGRDGMFDPVPDASQNSGVEHVVVFAAPAPSSFLSWDDLLRDAADATLHDPDPDVPALVWHTGGTTGTPKACYHTQRRFLAAGRSYGIAAHVSAGQRWAAAAPLGHALGFIYHTVFTLLHGATIVLIEQFSKPEVVAEAVDAHRVDTFTAVVATWARLRDVVDASGQEGALSSLKTAYGMWQSASSAGVREWCAERGLVLKNNFGSTAFATWVLIPQDDTPFSPGSLGRAAPGYEIKALDVSDAGIKGVRPGETGRLAVRGVSGLTYWNRPEMQARDVRDGWTLVDDLIRIDDAGNVDYLGRTDYLISTAGNKVAPGEVESVLARHPAVREVAVLAAPDPVRQEVVRAVVALAPGSAPSPGLKRELQEFVKAELAPYKYPRVIDFVEALPRDAVGKIQMKVLAELPSDRSLEPGRLTTS
jgi:2-aminobenzoate-CoA ligase